jgi:hypothetical protein
MNDLQWIIDIEPIQVTYENIKGKAIHFDPPITNIDYLHNIMDKLEKAGFITPKTIYGEIGVGIIGLYSYGYIKQIAYTANYLEDNETYQEHINNHAGKEVEVLNGRDIFLEL